MVDRRISCKLKGNVLSYVLPRHTEIETMTLTEKQQKIQVCENNVVRRIVVVNRYDESRMCTVKECFNKKLNCLKET